MARSLLQDVIKSEPLNPYWYSRLGQLEKLRGIQDDDIDWSKVAVPYSKACDLSRNADERLEYGIEAALAFAQFDHLRARREVLRAWSTMSDVKSSDLASFGSHFGNAVLGIAALADGDVTAAVGHMSVAGDSQRSPELFAYGPDLQLATQLAKLGRIDDVVLYLEKCSRLAPRYAATYDKWKIRLKAGDTFVMSHRYSPG